MPSPLSSSDTSSFLVRQIDHRAHAHDSDHLLLVHVPPTRVLRVFTAPVIGSSPLAAVVGIFLPVVCLPIKLRIEFGDLLGLRHHVPRMIMLRRHWTKMSVSAGLDTDASACTTLAKGRRRPEHAEREVLGAVDEPLALLDRPLEKLLSSGSPESKPQKAVATHVVHLKLKTHINIIIAL